YCRRIRNAYAHADNPDDARRSKHYRKYKPKLMTLDPDHTQDSIETFRQLHATCSGLIAVTSECSDVSALMLSICKILGSAAFFSLAAMTDRLRVVPAFFGADDAITGMSASSPEGMV